MADLEYLNIGRLVLSAPLKLATYTWAKRPNAARDVYRGTKIFVSDVGIAGSEWVSNGATWEPVNGSALLMQTGIPLIIPSSGSIGNNGALSGITALPVTFSGGCYMNFPAGAIAAGSTAGWYYVVMSSTSAGTIYNNTFSGAGAPVPVASPTAFITTGPGAYTQVVTEIQMASATVAGGVMGPHGRLAGTAHFIHPNNVNNKLLKCRFSGIGGTTVWSNTSTTTTQLFSSQSVTNSGSEAAQTVGPNSVGYTTSTSAYGTAAIDTTAATEMVYSGQLAVATDYLALVFASVMLVR